MEQLGALGARREGEARPLAGERVVRRGEQPDRQALAHHDVVGEGGRRDDRQLGGLEAPLAGVVALVEVEADQRLAGDRRLVLLHHQPARPGGRGPVHPPGRVAASKTEHATPARVSR